MEFEKKVGDQLKIRVPCDILESGALFVRIKWLKFPKRSSLSILLSYIFWLVHGPFSTLLVKRSLGLFFLIFSIYKLVKALGEKKFWIKKTSSFDPSS